MEKTVNVKSIVLSDNQEWYNLLTVEDKKVSVNIKANQILTKLLEDGKTELIGNFVEKDGKCYLWDIKPKSEKKPFGNPKNDKLILWQTCLKVAGEVHAEKGGSNTQDIADIVLKSTEKFFNKGLEILNK